MKKLLLALATLAAFACGDSRELIFTPPAPDAGAETLWDDGLEYEIDGARVSRDEAVEYALATQSPELGVAEQPLYADDGDGAEAGNQTRCQLSDNWGQSHECDFNFNKFYGIKVPHSTNTRGCSAQFIQAISSAVLAEGQDINASGGGWTVGTADDTDGAGFFFFIECINNSGKPQGTKASTVINASSSTGFSCSAAGGGKNACTFTQGHIEVYSDHITGTAGFSTSSTSQQARWIKNIVRHEVGHTASLGHPAGNDCGTSPLMCSSSDPVFEGQTDHALTAQEHSFLHRFNRSGTTPTP